MAQNTSDARLGIGTFGAPVTDGITRHTARMMNHCAMTQAAAAIQKITSSKTLGTSGVGNAVEAKAEDCKRKRDRLMGDDGAKTRLCPAPTDPLGPLDASQARIVTPPVRCAARETTIAHDLTHRARDAE